MNTKDRRITVWVNGCPKRLFPGLRVRHAVGADAARRVERGEARVLNEDGYRVDLDGALYDGERLQVRTGSPGEGGAAPAN